MLADDRFHRALFAVCAELVAASNSTAGHKFPESVEHCGLRPLDVCAVMEAVVRADSALPRELKRHLNSCHEQARARARPFPPLPYHSLALSLASPFLLATATAD